MIVEAKTESPDLSAAPSAESSTPLFASLQQSAELEFHATVQLLAERARFLTGAGGVAVALEQGGEFEYSAATGSLVPEIGAVANMAEYPSVLKLIQRGGPGLAGKTGLASPSLAAQQARLPFQVSGRNPNSALTVAISNNGKVVGFFELLRDAVAFEIGDVETVSRLAAMVGTALDHLEAAEHSKRLISEAREKPAPVSPILWHAPEASALRSAPAVNPSAWPAADVRACTACGFPVSGGRTLCVDCDAHRVDSKRGPKPLLSPAELFAVGTEESWLSAHGYTIASLLVTALAGAIVYWLR